MIEWWNYEILKVWNDGNMDVGMMKLCNDKIMELRCYVIMGLLNYGMLEGWKDGMKEIMKYGMI